MAFSQKNQELRKLEVPIWHIKLGWNTQVAIRLYRTRGYELEITNCDFKFGETRSMVVSMENWKSQFATSNRDKIGLRKRPYAFIEQGVAMLSSVLNSERAIQVNIAIMRTFVKLKQILSMNKELAHKLSELERKIEKHDVDIQAIFEAIRRLMAPPLAKPKPQMDVSCTVLEAPY
jgi:hypothetical protein